MAAQPHPQMAEIAAMLRDGGLCPADPLRQPLAAARAAARRFQAVWNQPLPAVNAVVEVSIPGPGRLVPLRIFYPQGRRGGVPVLLYFHGGGFVLNGLDTHERLMRLLALRSGAAVVGVGYALAPETRFPGQIEDGLAALAWLRRHGGNCGLDGGRVAVGGDSAGANLALALQLRLRDLGLPPVDLGILLYGMFSRDLDTSSHRAFGGGLNGLTTERVDWFWRQYLGETSPGGQADHPLAVPLAADLSGLPPQLVVGAGMDCLLDDSLRMAARLRGAGVHARLSVYEGVPHSFMQMSAHLEPADAAVSEAAAAVAGTMMPASLVGRAA